MISVASQGAEVDGEADDRHGHRLEANAEAGQAEEDDEELHDQRRVADRLDVGRDRCREPDPAVDAGCGACGADRQAGDRGDDHQNQGDAERPGR
jgi:hypothetical protein